MRNWTRDLLRVSQSVTRTEKDFSEIFGSKTYCWKICLVWSLLPTRIKHILFAKYILFVCASMCVRGRFFFVCCLFYHYNCLFACLFVSNCHSVMISSVWLISDGRFWFFVCLFVYCFVVVVLFCFVFSCSFENVLFCALLWLLLNGFIWMFYIFADSDIYVYKTRLQICFTG